MSGLDALTARPDNFARQLGLSGSFVLAVIAATAFALDTSALRSAFFSIVLVGLTIHVALAWRATCGNLFIMFRYALLSLLTWMTALVRVTSPDSLFTAPFGMAYQDATASATLVLAGTLATCAGLAGWLWPQTTYRRPRYPTAQELPSFQPVDRLHAWRYAVGAVAVAFAYVFAAGGFVSSSKLYADGGMGLPFEFNIFGILQASFVGLSILSVRNATARTAMPIYAVCMASFILCMAAGSRADYLPGLLIILLIAVDPQRRCGWSIRRLLNGLLVSLAGFIAASALALWRFSTDLSLIGAASQFLSLGGELLFADYSGNRVLWIETGNHMLGGFYGFIAQIGVLGQDHLYGSSYAAYLLRLPPAFLGLPRPEGLEWQTGIGGEVMSQGGVWEPAEAWMNFGMAGCLVVPFLWSRLMRWTLDRYLAGSDALWWMWYCAMGLMCVRTTWYQNFAFVRIASVILVFWLGREVYKMYQTQHNRHFGA